LGQLRHVRAKKGMGTGRASLPKIQLAIGSMRGVNTYQIDGCGETEIVDSLPPDFPADLEAAA
jgi:hypothetical protein